MRKTIRIKQRARRKRREEGDREEEEGWKRTRQMKGRRKRRKRGSVGRSVSASGRRMTGTGDRDALHARFVTQSCRC